VLRIDAVSRRFAGGTEALRDVSLSVPRGQFLVVLGPSGCGKSTLLRLIAGIERPDAGSVAWDRGAAPGGREGGGIGFVFQDATLMPWASAGENVGLPLRLRGLGKAERRVRAAAMMRQMGLGEFIDARPHQLSGGMRMRVSIARALVDAPALLLMDEPFAALDEFLRHQLQSELRRLAGADACTVIFVTHSLYEAAFLADRVVILSSRPGRIVADRVFDAPVGERDSPAFAERVRWLGAGMMS
jgi:NitT/TauT family transport system ATP-binding protein